MKTSIRLFVSLTILFMVHSLQAEDLFPQEWITLPEYQESSQSSDKGLDHQRPDGTFNNILDGQTLVLSEIKTSTSHGNRERWRLEALRLSLAISAKGLMGLVSMNGKSSAIMTWKRKEPEARITGPEEKEEQAELVDQDDEIIALDALSTPEELEKRVNETIDFSFASLPVPSRVKAKKSLLKRTLEMQKIFVALASGSASHGPDWYVGTLRYDVSFSAKGDVLPVLSMQGEVKLRLEFFAMRPIESRHLTSHLASHLTSLDKGITQSPVFKKTQKFAEGLLADAQYALQSKAANSIQESGFDLSIIRIGLGLGVSGSVGVAGLGGKTMAYLYLHRTPHQNIDKNKSHVLHNLPPATEFSGKETMDYFTDSNEARMRYAKENGIGFHADGEDKSLLSPKLFKVPRARFRKGLVGGLRMGSYFTNKLKGRVFRGWKLDTIENEYELSIGGDLRLVKVDGIGVVRFIFQAK